MSTPSSVETRSLEQLSALADGELDAAGTLGFCEAWRSDPQARATWHAYHLIGDVLRSDDLAADPGHDAAFLESLRARLDREPVVLVPGLTKLASARSPSAAGEQPQRRWAAPTAMAAGFVLVVGAVLFARPGILPFGGVSADGLAVATPPAGDARPIARLEGAAARPQGPAEAGPERVAAGTAAPRPNTSDAATLARSNVLRDPRLDSYLAAHKQFSGSSALGMPSVFLRSATVAAPSR